MMGEHRRIVPWPPSRYFPPWAIFPMTLRWGRLAVCSWFLSKCCSLDQGWHCHNQLLVIGIAASQLLGLDLSDFSQTCFENGWVYLHSIPPSRHIWKHLDVQHTAGRVPARLRVAWDLKSCRAWRWRWYARHVERAMLGRSSTTYIIRSIKLTDWWMKMDSKWIVSWLWFL
jgi:hypothetical protein